MTAVATPATSAAPRARTLDGRSPPIRSATAPLSNRFISPTCPAQLRRRLEPELERPLALERPLEEDPLRRLELERPRPPADVRPRALLAVVRVRPLDVRPRPLDAELRRFPEEDRPLDAERPRLPADVRPRPFDAERLRPLEEEPVRLLEDEPLRALEDELLRPLEDEPLRPLDDERPRPLAERTVLARRGALARSRDELPLLDEPPLRRDELPFCGWGECELSVS
jgi:hypothetical protein